VDLLDWSDFADHFATVAAVLVAGFWFFVQRGHTARLAVNHEVTHFQIAPGQVLLTVIVRMANKGHVRIRVATISTRIQQVLPLDLDPEDSQRVLDGITPLQDKYVHVHWPQLAEWEFGPQWKTHEIEPGDTDEVVFDFIVPDTLESIRAYTYVANVRKWRRSLGWSRTSVVRLKGPQLMRCSDGEQES
jgi:hypothetical protein